MEFIEDKTVYKAVMYAKKLRHEYGFGWGAATHVAGRAYDVPAAEIGKYLGQESVQVQRQRAWQTEKNSVSSINKVLDTLYRIGEYRNDLTAESVYNTVASLSMARYAGEVIVTKGNYLDGRETVVKGSITEVVAALNKLPTLAASATDPNGIHATCVSGGFSVMEVFAPFYEGENYQM